MERKGRDEIVGALRWFWSERHGREKGYDLSEVNGGTEIVAPRAMFRRAGVDGGIGRSGPASFCAE